MLAFAFAVLAEQLDLIMPDEEEIGQACNQIQDLVSRASTLQVRKSVTQLTELLIQSDTSDSPCVLDLLENLLPQVDRPWPLLSSLIKSENDDLPWLGIELTLGLIANGHLDCDRNVLQLLAEVSRQEDSPFDEGDRLTQLRKTIHRHYRPAGASAGRGLHHLLIKDPDADIRRLAARLLDLDDALPDIPLSRKVLGDEAWQVLGPYLTYTRATHTDLVNLTGSHGVSPRVLQEIKEAGAKHGGVLVRQVVATLGWPRLNQGLVIQEFVRLDWPDTAPLYVHPEEVGLFATSPPPQHGPTLHLVRARGGMEAATRSTSCGHDQVDGFRRINIAHAELLSEFLETAPAGRRKIRRIIKLMDEVVAAFYDLFADIAEEYRILPDVWQQLRRQTEQKLAAEGHGRDLPADLVRLVMAFEDPATLGEVRTIHGLKRLLHQHGLKLGFDLVDTGHAANRTVDLLLIPSQGDPVIGPTIHFAELEPAPEPDPEPWLPYPVRLAAEALGWQLLHGTTTFPGLEIFIFGNEVHYYISFRNHPAFLRVDFSPPQRGGMLDLEYYGVSNYETDIHPNPKLDAICSFFRALHLEVRVEGTRLFVRYDKERSHSLADLQDKVASLLRFSPFLMDVDWVVGSLQMPPQIRNTVVEAWAARFAHSGVFPKEMVLTQSRRQILLQRKIGPGGEEEESWSGQGPYRDCWQGATPADLWENFTVEARRLGLPTPTAEARTFTGPLPLLPIHRHILQPIRRRLRSGQICLGQNGLEPADPNLCRQEHETQFFARLLASESAATTRLLTGAVAMAPAIAYLEKFIQLSTTGFVGGLRVERGRLALRGGELRVYVGRDEHGVIRLGVGTFEDRLLRSRNNRRATWRTNAWTDAEALLALMRSANYVGDNLATGNQNPTAEIKALRHLARLPGPGRASGLTTEANLLEGAAAAPGRATGRAVFGTAGHRAEDLIGALLIAREIRPSDSRFLMQSGGIISTGGAVLSHAALLATQFGKPAMVVEAEWDETGPVPALVFQVTLYRTEEQTLHGLHVCRRSVTAHTSGRLEEGDLCILDARRQVVRVLGQDPDTLILWQGFQLLARAQAAGDQTGDPQKTLDIRAQKLRARHQIGKALHRLTSGAVADFAVEEIVLSAGLSCLPISVRGEFLDELMSNPAVRDRVQPQLLKLSQDLADGLVAAVDRYLVLTPGASCQFQILGWRLRCLRLQESLDLVHDLQIRCGMKTPEPLPPEHRFDDDVAWRRLRHLERDLKKRIKKEGPHLRHALRRLDRLQQALPGSSDRGGLIATATETLAEKDAKTHRRLAKKFVLQSGQCGLETHRLIGWKGANLAEIDRLAGSETVPPWFAVTDAALQMMLATPLVNSETVKRHLNLDQCALGSAIRDILKMERADCAAKARFIGQLWTEVEIPEKLTVEVSSAHAKLASGSPTSGSASEPFLAVRSSSCDEDSESSMQAGIYDTFLFVQGCHDVMESLRRTWAGMWTERALFAREMAGDIGKEPMGGIVVQRMVEARVSGVLQTVNVAAGDLNELIINVGLGLGEGIVSGLVAADMIKVVKDQATSRDQLHFNYLTNDKPQQMVFDKRRGQGTRLEDTLYHQRLRPAMEYSELCELARKTFDLEAAYGYPLDIEFAIENDRLWLLQARPISVILAEHKITLDQYPLKKPARKRPTTGD